MTIACNTLGTNSVCATADDFCLNQVEYLFDIYTGRDEYDIRYLAPDPFPPTYYIDHLNSPRVQAAIGAYVNFSESNGAVSAAFGNTGDDDREIGVTQAMRDLLAANVTLILYWGDADYVCNWLAGTVTADELSQTSPQAAGYSSAGFANISTSDGEVHGQVRQSGKFAYVRIYESGHEVPFYKPLVALEMFERVVKGLDIETGEISVGASYRTSGPKVSSFKEGNGTVQFEVVGGEEPVVYDTATGLPVFENGTSADTGPNSQNPPGLRRRWDGGVVDEEMRIRREKRARGRKDRLRNERRNGQKRGMRAARQKGVMRRDQLLGGGL
jgi:carboxypeptidase D